MSPPRLVGSFKRAEDLCDEAHKAYLRSGELRSSDYNGAIEAAQQCIELSIKGLYQLVGLKYPTKHDPGIQLENVVERLNGLPDNQKVSIARAKWISKMWDWAHSTSIYVPLNVRASKVFREKDAENAIDYAREVFVCCYNTLHLLRTGQIMLAS